MPVVGAFRVDRVTPLQQAGGPPKTSLSEELRRELFQVDLPVDPGMAAARLPEHGRERVLLEEGDSLPGPRHQKIIGPGREPQ
jgi:hypothetical protein